MRRTPGRAVGAGGARSIQRRPDSRREPPRRAERRALRAVSPAVCNGLRTRFLSPARASGPLAAALVVAALGPLAAAAQGQDPERADSAFDAGVAADGTAMDRWDSPLAHAIVRQAIDARQHAYADSSLTRFSAEVQGHVYFLGEFRGEREIVRADQVALDVYWQAPDRALQTIVGRRHEVRLPTNIKYHLDHLSLVLDNFGDRIRLGNGDEVWNVLHPAAPGALDTYAYRLADSLEIRVRERIARVYELDVRPRDPTRPAVVGSMFVDRATGAIARLRITFTRAAYRDPHLESIALDLRSAFWEGRYWLPSEQQLEIRRSLSWLDFPLESIIRTRLEVLDYDLGGAAPWNLAPGERVASLPAGELERFWQWESPLYGGPVEDEDRSIEDLGAAVGRARSLVRPIDLVGGERLQIAIPDASSALRARRAEGVLVGGGGHARLGDATTASLWGGYASGSERIEASAAIDRHLGAWDGRVEAHLHGLRDAGYFRTGSGVEQTLGLAFEGEDYTDPYFEDGGRVSIAHDVGSGRAEVGASVLRQRSADLIMQTVLIGNRALRPVRPIDDGELAALDMRLEMPLGRALGTAWSAGVAGEAATGAIGSFGFSRATLTLRGEREGLGSPWAWSSRLTVGLAGGDLPAQRLFLVGGRGTLPGYAFRQWGGDRVALWQGEVSRAVVSPWVRVRVLGAAAWTDLAGPGAAAATRFGVLDTPGVRTSAGVGLGLFYDLLRVEVVRGLEGPRADDPRGGEWELLVSLNPMLWDIL